ncbi:MAG: integrase core domain-containing protein [Bryobacteraceae bacterium]
MDERLRCVQDVHRPGWSIAELCRRYAVSRKTGYKWLAAYEHAGPVGLVDGSHRPHTCPHATAPPIVDLILQLQRRYTWGARKVRRLLQGRVPADQVPTKTTVHRILERDGRVQPRRRSRRRFHAGPPDTPMAQPNAVWTADFKGQFRTGNGVYCYPLTIQDGASRFLLGRRGLLTPTTEASWPVFVRLFQRYGLPERIRSDNGQPFASTALGRLSTLSVWWVRLGIRPELIEPAHPEQNGRHERMHQTLKADTARPPEANLCAQQRRFDWFRHRYNEERPHEALADATPASCYAPSGRPYRATLEPLDYPGHFERRRVSHNGGIRWLHRWVNVSHLLAELEIGFEEIDDGLWNVYFGPVWLGRFHEAVGRIVDQLDRPARRRGGNHKGRAKVLPIT